MARKRKEEKYERKRRRLHITISDQAHEFLENRVTNASRFIDELLRGAENGNPALDCDCFPDWEWARPDSNRRPPPCEGDVMTS